MKLLYTGPLLLEPGESRGRTKLSRTNHYPCQRSADAHTEMPHLGCNNRLDWYCSDGSIRHPPPVAAAETEYQR